MKFFYVYYLDNDWNEQRMPVMGENAKRAKEKFFKYVIDTKEAKAFMSMEERTAEEVNESLKQSD